MRTRVQDKYALRDLHNEMNLLDRKLNHVLRFEVFESEALRDVAARKLANKREQLNSQAKAITDLGITLPETTPSVEAVAPQNTVQPIAEPGSEFGEKVTALERENSVAVSSLASWQDDLEAYKRRRSRVSAA